MSAIVCAIDRTHRAWRRGDPPGIPDKTAKDDQEVIHIMLSKDGISVLLVRSHDLADSSDMGYDAAR